MAHFLPYGKQFIDEDDIAAVTRVLKSPFLTQGPIVEKFEKALCDYTGAKYCVAVANGTAALHLAVAVLNVSEPCSGVTTPITFLASANALVYNGVKPLFADVDPITANLSPSALEDVLKKDTKIIIPVHFAGRPALMKDISKVALRRNAYVIEDAAHALGSRYSDGSRVGNCTYSDMTIFSFHPVKMITTGEGGAIMTNSRVIYDRLKRLRSHGVKRDFSVIRQRKMPWFYEMRELGFNYRLTDIHAALGLAQLKKMNRFLQRRANIVSQYNKVFDHLSWLRPVSADDVSCGYHLYVVRINYKYLQMSRGEVMNKFQKSGIGSQVHYIPVYHHPYYKKTFGMKKGLCPEAEKYYAECLSLPLFPAMTDNDVKRVIKAVLKIGGGCE